MKLYLFSTKNRNFPQDTVKVLEQGEIAHLRFDSLQEMMESPEIEGNGLYLMEIGSQEDFARAQVAAEWVSVLRPQSRFIFLLASKNLKIPEGLGPMIDSLSLPLPPKSFFFKLQLAHQLLHQPVPKAASDKKPLPLFRIAKKTPKEFWIDGPSGGPKAGRWQSMEEGKSSKVRWRWIPSDPFDRSLTFGLSWVTEAPQPPEWNDQQGQWKISLEEGVSLKAWRGEEELCALECEPSEPGSAQKIVKNIEEGSSEDQSADPNNNSSFQNRDVAAEIRQGSSTENKSESDTPQKKESARKIQEVQPSSTSSSSKSPEGESVFSEKKNSQKVENRSVADVINVSPLDRTIGTVINDENSGLETRQNRQKNELKDKEILLKDHTVASFLNRTLSQDKSSAINAAHRDQIQKEEAKIPEKETAEAQLNEEKEKKVSEEKFGHLAREGRKSGSTEAPSQLEGLAKNLKEAVKEASTSERARQELQREKGPASKPMALSAAVQLTNTSSIKATTTEEEAARGAKKEADESLSTPSREKGSLVAEEASAEKEKKESTAETNSIKNNPTKTNDPVDNQKLDFKFAYPKNGNLQEDGLSEQSARITSFDKVSEVSIRVGGADRIVAQYYDPIKKRPYFLFSLAELGDRDSIWYPLTVTRVYLSADARYKDSTKLQLFPLWIYTGILAPEFLEELKLWKFYDSPPLWIGGIDECKGELREFMEKLMYSGFLIEEEIAHTLERMKAGSLSIEGAQEEWKEREKSQKKGFFQWLKRLLQKRP